MTMTSLNWQVATDLVAEVQSVLIVTHVKPDGDAIGSILGLSRVLRKIGKTVDVAVDDGVPDYLEFLVGDDPVFPKLTMGSWDLMISVDASDEARTGKVGAYGMANADKVLNVDHHATNNGFGDAQLVVPEAVSATEIVYHWLDPLGATLDEHIATPLLAGIVTDTMGFRTSNVTPTALGVAQALMAAGASLRTLTARTLESRPYRMLHLWGQAMGSLQLDGQVVSVDITQENYRTAGVREVTDGGLVGLLNTVDEAMIAVTFKELPDERVEIGLRSKFGFDVGSVALGLGGGGHPQAAGATVAGMLAEVRARVMPLLHEAAAAGEARLG